MSFNGATDLDDLIKHMSPSLDAAVFVYAKLPFASSKLGKVIQKLSSGGIRMLYMETEAWTVVLTHEVAEELDLDHTFTCRQITLNIHSSLEAVGFLAAITTRLAKLGTGVNPISAYYHDHLFVPIDQAEAVMAELKAMTAERQ